MKNKKRIERIGTQEIESFLNLLTTVARLYYVKKMHIHNLALVDINNGKKDYSVTYDSYKIYYHLLKTVVEYG